MLDESCDACGAGGLGDQSRVRLHDRHRLTERFLADEDDFVDLLSLHFHRARRYQESWRYSREAGEVARGRYALVEASTF